ncbi:carbon-monoxide dehydrogenase medium subunit [Nonomuraea polychroma]|uniref:Carbon-monoxide dehydrogenase medium subunit n=1 Tax=Nonomuraea polychroma TaxID=46176 RepID=A0A438MBQ7_9ACTN|nr:FAD binding domain-containing protein [Nonomuraea polychroma]RVX43041.1 carbon-monoxide dehydrogenase medium subunit [Nonomuraea polychroma]
MKPPPFEYHAPRDLGAALRTLAEVRGKVLAGGQSLIPMLNMRLTAPEHLVDINHVASLGGIESLEAGVRVGALARHSEVARAGAHPLLTRALKLVAHPAIRNRGTVVGSLVHADPAAELPAVLAVLGGSVRVARSEGDAQVERDVPAEDFFTGPMESAVQPGELAVSAYFPALGRRTGGAFEEVARRHGDYALAGVCAVVTLDEEAFVTAAKVACVGVGPVPVVVDVGEASGHCPVHELDWAEVARLAQSAVEPEDDIHASAAYRRHLVGVLAERALRNAAREAETGGA